MDRKMRLQKAENEDFDSIYDELEKNFILEERREREKARALISDGAYTVYHVLDDETHIGFITVWELTGFAFVEHFVTYDEFRNKGYGSAALELLKEKYGNIVLEAEPPEGEMPARRVAFYERNGFHRNEQYYFQPPFRKGGKGVELKLMSYPTLLADFHTVAKEIYARVYGREYLVDKA